jgi:hypothetical protein
VLGTQCILGTPREPFSQIIAKDIVYENIYCANIDWEDEKRIYKFYYFCVWMDNHCLRTFKGSKPRSSAKRFPKKVSGLILNKSLKFFHYQREKTQPEPTIHHVRKASTC